MADAGDGVTLTARELRLRVALGPLLAGQVDARELAVSGADLSLPWPPAPGALGQRPPAWLTGLQARLEDSRVAVGGLVLTGIGSTLAVDADTGTLSAASANGVAVTGSGSGTLVLTGTLADVNAYLATDETQPVFRQAVTDFNGIVTLTMTSNDNANGGSGAGGCHLPPPPLRVDWIMGGGGASFSGYRQDAAGLHRASDHYYLYSEATATSDWFAPGTTP